jgi:hypothetical protein
MAASENGKQGQAQTALQVAGIAAAGSAAALVARRAFQRRRDAGDNARDAVTAGVRAAWDAAREAILPTLEQSAAAAGRYVAENAPETLRESILPRFFDGFHEMREQREGDEAEAGSETRSSGGE